MRQPTPRATLVTAALAGALGGALATSAITTLHAQQAPPLPPPLPLPQAAPPADLVSRADYLRLVGEVRNLSARVTVLENRAGVGLTKPPTHDDWSQ